MSTNDLDTSDVPANALNNDENLPPSPMLPPTAPFAATSSMQDVVIPSSQSSFTRIDHDGEHLAPHPASHDSVTPSATLPTLQATENTATGDHFVPLISTVSQESEQLKVETETTGQPEHDTEEPVPQTPQTYLTFLLISGKRRTMSFEPDTTIGRVKELVWNSWPTDWQDDRPPAPSYLRVLYLGRMLQDDETLNNNLKLPTHTPQQPTPSSPSSPGPTPTIMHLSIRPYPPPGEGDAIKKKKKRVIDDPSTSNEPNDANDDAGCCRCIIC